MRVQHTVALAPWVRTCFPLETARVAELGYSSAEKPCSFVYRAKGFVPKNGTTLSSRAPSIECPPQIIVLFVYQNMLKRTVEARNLNQTSPSFCRLPVDAHSKLPAYTCGVLPLLSLLYPLTRFSSVVPRAQPSALLQPQRLPPRQYFTRRSYRAKGWSWLGSL